MVKYLLLLLSLALIVSAQRRIKVICDLGDDLVKELAILTQPTRVEVSGECYLTQTAIISIDGIHLVTEPGYTALITAMGDFPVLFIDGGRNVTVDSLPIRGGSTGILLDNQASVVLRDSQVIDCTNGIRVAGQSYLQLDNVRLVRNTGNGLDGVENSAVVLISTLTITNTGNFALILSESSSLTFRNNAQATLTSNAFGVQISSGSSFFLDQGSFLSVTKSTLIGLSVNVGGSMILFRANVVTSESGLDGASITLGGTLFVDQTASWIANSNLRDGIRIEQGIVRLSNLAGGGPDNLGPLIQTNNNGRRGISVGRNSFLDLQSPGPIRGIQSSGNSQLLTDGDLWVDYSSSCTLRFSTVGLLVAGFYSILDTASSTVTSVVCDGTVKTRGTISCPP